MPNTTHITAGLTVAKTFGQAPTAGVNTCYVTAGIPPEVGVAGASKSVVIGGGIIAEVLLLIAEHIVR